MNNVSNHERNISLVFLDLGEVCPIQTEQRYVQVLGPDKRILEKGIQHMDRRRLSLVGGIGANLPRKIFNTEVLGNGISGILRPSQGV